MGSVSPGKETSRKTFFCSSSDQTDQMAASRLMQTSLTSEWQLPLSRHRFTAGCSSAFFSSEDADWSKIRLERSAVPSQAQADVSS